MIRRFGEQPRDGQAYKRRPGAYAILTRGSDLLLTHQSEPLPEFQLPGGGIDPGESPLAALHREVFEETGWTIAAPRRVGTFRRFTFMPEYNLWAEKICTVYVAWPAHQIGPPSERGHTAVWMAPEIAIQKLGNAGDRHFVSRLIDGLKRS